MERVLQESNESASQSGAVQAINHPQGQGDQQPEQVDHPVVPQGQVQQQQQVQPAAPPVQQIPAIQQAPGAPPAQQIPAIQQAPGEYSGTPIIMGCNVSDNTVVSGQVTETTHSPVTPQLASQGAPRLAAVCDPLGDHLSQSVKDKIGRGEYVDLGSILEEWSPSQSQQDDPVGLVVSYDELGRAVFKQASKTSRKISTISMWTNAFLIYSSVYLVYHPNRAQELLKYMHTVRSAATRFGSYGWRQYDINFRKRMGRNPQNSWANIDGELWYLFVVAPPSPHVSLTPTSTRGANYQVRRPELNTPRNVSTTRSGPRQAASAPRFPQGPRACFGFNKKEGCSFGPKCKFAHVCNYCKKAGHNFIACKDKK